MPKHDLFSIGEVAQMFHLSVGSLRHYEKAGLLKPEYISPESGYRYYSTRQFEVLTTIRFLRILDMPLEQIRDFLNNREISKMQHMLQNQKEAILQKKKELELMERKIDQQLVLIEDAIHSDLGRISVKHILEKRVAWLKNTVSPKSYFDLETSIRQLENGQNGAGIWLGKIGVGIALSRLKEHAFSTYDMVFLTLDFDEPYTGTTEIWPACDCACLRFCGSHKDAPRQYELLLNWIKENRMVPYGFSRETTLIDDGITSDPDRFVTEIQIPVHPIQE
ncbi:MerR family transcriptional regulator [Ventrimonas sp. CLA-AP-H27]|uniref:MerR family transcriptional regulator n=1 Tax=Ventrimonas faecis TaxID=3133170 RepID=A0ABV1HLZ3_9FIRM